MRAIENYAQITRSTAPIAQRSLQLVVIVQLESIVKKSECHWIKGQNTREPRPTRSSRPPHPSFDRKSAETSRTDIAQKFFRRSLCRVQDAQRLGGASVTGLPTRACKTSRHHLWGFPHVNNHLKSSYGYGDNSISDLPSTGNLGRNSFALSYYRGFLPKSHGSGPPCHFLYSATVPGFLYRRPKTQPTCSNHRCSRSRQRWVRRRILSVSRIRSIAAQRHPAVLDVPSPGAPHPASGAAWVLAFGTLSNSHWHFSISSRVCFAGISTCPLCNGAGLSPVWDCVPAAPAPLPPSTGFAGLRPFCANARHPLVRSQRQRRPCDGF